jgi:Na+-driven multidrug efflux pump
MVMLDFLLIPPFGIVGAGLASTVGSLVGFAVFLGAFRRRAPLRDFFPSASDCLDILAAIVRTVGHLLALTHLRPLRARQRDSAYDG